MLHALFFRSLARRFLAGCFALTIATAGLVAQTSSVADGFDPNVDGNVYAVAVQPDGKTIIAGQFATLQPNGALSPVARNNIARLNVDGSVDATFNPDVNGPVRALVVRGGQIVIGGDFTSVGGVVRNRVARLNDSGSVDAAFDPNVTGPIQPQVLALAVQPDGAVIVGGYFANVQPAGAAAATPRRNLARFTAAGALDANWNPSPNGVVLALLPHINNSVVVGGGFTNFQVGGTGATTARNRIARVNADGTLDASFDPDANNAVQSLAAQRDGKILIGGSFTLLKTTSRSRLARLNTDGSLDTTFSSGASGQVKAIAVAPDGGIVIAGPFLSIWSGTGTTVGRSYLARFAPDGAADASFGPNFNAEATSFDFQSDGKIVVGGYFTRAAPAGTVSAIVRNHVARLNLNGSVDTTFQLNPGGRPLVSVVQSDGKILIGGSFFSVGGATRNGFARLNADGSLDTSFVVPEINGNVYAILPLAGGKILIGGEFTRVGGETHNRLARMNADGSVDATFSTGTDGPVTALVAQADGAVLVGGAFSNIQGTSDTSSTARANIARINGSTGAVDTAFSPGVNQAVTSIVVQSDNKIIIAGRFSVVAETGGVQFSRSRIARLNPDGKLDVTYDPNFNDTISALALQRDGKLLVGGAFTALAPRGATEVTTRNRIARINQDGTLDPAFDPNANGNVLALAVQGNDQILVGGTFTTLQPAGDSAATTRNYIARLAADGKLDTGFDLNLDERSGNRVDSITVGSDNAILVGGNFSSAQPSGSTARVARANLLRLTSAGSLDTSFELGAVSGTFAGTINAIVTQPDGKIVVAGEFSDLGGANNNDIARFHPEGTVDISFSSALNADGAINAVAVRTNSTAVVSQLTGFAFLNSDGTLRTSFAPGANARFTGEINAAVVDAQGRILLGGLFGNVDTGTSANLARFNADGSLDTTFNPTVSDRVRKIVVQPDGKIIIVGNFLTVNGTTRRRIARLETNGALDTAFDPNADASISSVVLQADGKIVVGGEFRTLTPNQGTTATTRNYLARIEPGGTIDAAYNPNPNGPIYALAVQSDGKIIAGGGFTALQPGATGAAVERSGVARINVDGTVDANFAPSPNASVRSILVEPNDSLVLGGEFTSFNVSGTQVTRRGLARVSSAGQLDTSFDPNPNGPVLSIARESNGSLLVSGNFSVFQPGSTGPTILRDRFARVSSAGVIDPAFNPDFVGQVSSVGVAPDGGVLVTGTFTGVQPNGLLIVGGAFTSIGGIGAERLALLADDGSVSGAFQPKPNAPVNAIVALPDGGFLVGGDFTTIAGASRSYVARFTADNVLDEGFNPALSDAVVALARQSDGKILVSLRSSAPVRLNADGSIDGSFSGSVAPLGSRGIAVQPDGRILIVANQESPLRDVLRRLNTDGSIDATFTPRVSNPGNIRSFTLQADGTIVVAEESRVVRLTADGAVDNAFSVSANGAVNAIAVQSDGRVMIGGNFTRVGDSIRVGLARVSQLELATDTLGVTADRSTVIWSRSGPTVELMNATFEISTDARNWTALGNGTRMGGTANWQLTGQSLPAAGLFYIRARGVTVASAGKSTGLHEVVRQFTYQNPLGTAASGGEVATDAISIDPATGVVQSVPPSAAGVYFSSTSATPRPTIIGVASTAKVVGAGEQVGSNIVHPNGNTYDQVLLEGSATTVTADPGEVVRLSLRDLTGSIVQVEFSGAGSLSLVLDGASAPAPADNYNQPGVNYVTGHAGIIIVGADQTTNVAVFSVGPLTAVNQSLFRSDVTYDGVADIAYLAISSTDGKFGSVRTGNVNFFATRGLAGIYAPGVHFSGAVNVGDINGYDAAVSMFVIGSAPETSITGGDLWQQNGEAVIVSGITDLKFTDGMTSHGTLLPAQTNRAPLEEYEPAAAAPQP